MAFSSTEQTLPSQSSGTPLSGGSSKGVSPGAIAGITVGVLMAVVCILLFMFWRMLARRRRNSTQAHGSVDPFNEKQRQSFPLDYIQSRPVSDPTSIAMPRTYVSNTSIYSSFFQLATIEPYGYQFWPGIIYHLCRGASAQLDR